MHINTSIKTLIMLLLHINEKDKIVALNVLKEELNDLDLINSNQETDILVGNLKTGCRYIEDAIEKAIYFAKYRKDLRQQRQQLLIGQAKQLNVIKEQYEAKLIELGFERNEIEETNFEAAFDFELLPKRDLRLLPNSIEIENNIRKAIDEFIPKKEGAQVKDKSWFKIGVLLATGDLMVLYEKKNRNATQTTLELVDRIGIKETDRPYISDSIYNAGKSKNIYKRLDWMQAIVNHCKTENITITLDFMDKYKATLDKEN